MTISQTFESVKTYYKSGVTRSLSFRLDALKKLKGGILRNQDLICSALKEDLGKVSMESYMTEIGMVLEEISYTQKHLKSWMKVHRVATPLAQFKSKSFQLDEPYGTVLIIAPWNYPIQLSLSPLVGAIAGGNTAIVKPSSYAKKTSVVIAKLLTECFDPSFVAVIEGGRAENTELLEQKFDYIFFTGSVAVGKIVMEAASKHLTPVTLELGGKSPVVVEKSANIKLAARRIAFGKVLNSGQTCVAPDYLLIDETVKDEFIKEFKLSLAAFFPNGDYSNYPHIVNDKHFKRLSGLLQGEKILEGGTLIEKERKITPTLVEVKDLNCPLMKEEIFGPILPLITFKTIDEIYPIIDSYEKPLAFYLFTTDKTIETKVFSTCSFGGGCVNDTIIHLATSFMPFGGVGGSGMGHYHGVESYKTFTHSRSIVKKANWIDLPMRYHPYNEKKGKLVKLFLK